MPAAKRLKEAETPSSGGEPPLMGERLRALRKNRGMTLHQLSALSGLSPGYLSQIERNISHPSIRALSDVARVFGVSMSRLFETPEQGQGDVSQFIVRGGARTVMNLTPGIREEVLSPDLDGPLKLFSTVIAPGMSSGPSGMRHKGAEGGLVTQGVLELTLGEQTYLLRAGDSFTFSSQVHHRFSNPGKQPTVVVWAIAVDAPS